LADVKAELDALSKKYAYVEAERDTYAEEVCEERSKRREVEEKMASFGPDVIPPQPQCLLFLREVLPLEVPAGPRHRPVVGPLAGGGGEIMCEVPLLSQSNRQRCLVDWARRDWGCFLVPREK